MSGMTCGSWTTIRIGGRVGICCALGGRWVSGAAVMGDPSGVGGVFVRGRRGGCSPGLVRLVAGRCADGLLGGSSFRGS